MTTPHVHQATINAWAAGAQIQWRSNDRDRWEDADHPGWSPDFQYRVKNPHQALIDAHEAGKLIELEIEPEGYWRATLKPDWNERHNYRVSPRSAELKALIEAHKAGSEIEMRVVTGGWDRCSIPIWSSHVEYRVKDKFADLKKAFSEGKLIESFNTDLGQFCVDLCPTWDESVEHRISPRQDELKPVIEAHLKGKQIEFNQRSYPDWDECVGSPKWQASNDYRVKTRWQKELDAWRAGKKIECRQTDRVDTWDVQTTANLDYYLLNPRGSLEYRVYDEYRDLKEAEARGEVIEMRLRQNGLWYAQQGPCHFNEPIENYRISPRSAELRPILDAYKAGKTIQGFSNNWLDLGVPMFDSKTTYRIKPDVVWQKELDAYLKGEVIQCFTRDKWHDQDRISALERELRDGSLGLKFRIKPEPLKSRRYVWANPGGRPQVSICDPNNHHKIPASSFVRWIDDDWVETEV